MLKRQTFQIPVLLITPAGLGPIEKTGCFKPVEGKLESIFSPDESGFYKIELAFRKKLNFFPRSKNKKSKTEKILRQAVKNDQGGNRSFCLKSADLPDETLAAYLGKKVRINPGLIEVLA